MSKIKLIIIDVDGTLTDGKLYLSKKGENFKVFNVKDGYGISVLLKKLGIEPVVITGRKSKIVSNRCRELGIRDIYQGIDNKLASLQFIASKKNLKLSEIAYIGDDLNDYECMQKIIMDNGIVACPQNAAQIIKDISSFVSNKDGGDGAVREFIDWLFKLGQN